MEASEATEEVPTVHDPPPPVSAHLICSTKALLNDMVVQGGHSSHRIRYGGQSYGVSHATSSLYHLLFQTFIILYIL